MVSRMLQAVYREIRGLHEAAYILALFTLASQLLALLRDRLFASQFGAGVELDLYYAAFRIPDLLFVVFASVLSVYVLIPFVTERLAPDGGPALARHLLSQIFTLFIAGYTVVAVLLFVFTPQIVSFVFPGFSSAESETLAVLMRVMLLQPFLLSLSNLFGVVTQISSRFALYALSPILYNVGIILGIVFLYPHFGLLGLVFGVILGAGFHVAIQIPAMEKSSLMPFFTHRFEWSVIAKILRTSLPRALTLSLHQIVLLVFVGIAASMAVGSVAVFQFAYNLQSVPLAIVGVSYSVAAFPTLVRMFTSGERREFLDLVASALRHIFFWSIPAIALIIVIRAQLVRVILGSGEFDWHDTRLTAAALALFAFSLAAQAVNLLIIRAFYAGGDTRTPLTVTLLSSSCALVFGFSLTLLFFSSESFRSAIESLLRVSDVAGTEVLMLPLGFAGALVLHSALLLFLFMRTFGLAWVQFGGAFARSIVAALAGGIVSYTTLNALVYAIKNDTFPGIFLQGFLSGALGIGTIIFTLYLLKSPELTEVYRALHRRIRRNEIIAPQQSDDVSTT